MPRTPRASFPCVHSLYLAKDQDKQVRRLAERWERTVSELMREALADYLAKNERTRRKLGAEEREPSRGETRSAILQRADERREQRGVPSAPTMRGPGMTLTTPLVYWQASFRMSPRDEERTPYDDNVVPLAVDDEGEPFEPPANAAGWRVLVQRWQRGEAEPCYTPEGYALVLPLGATHAELCQAVWRQTGRYHLQLIDEHGRVLRCRAVRVPLGYASEWDDD